MKLISCASSDGYMMRNGEQEYSMACLNTIVLDAAKRSIREGLLPVKSVGLFVCGRTMAQRIAQGAMQIGIAVCVAIIVGCGRKRDNRLFNHPVRLYKRFYRLLW